MLSVGIQSVQCSSTVKYSRCSDAVQHSEVIVLFQVGDFLLSEIRALQCSAASADLSHCAVECSAV